MTVYVTPLCETIPSKRWPYRHGAKLFADTQDELDGFGERLGLLPHWKHFPFEPKEHFDVVEAIRLKAIKFGAKPVGIREMIVMIEKKRIAAAKALADAS